MEQWAVLAAVIDHGGFARAAISTNRSQSAVSYAVAQLQDAIGVPLLELRGRKSVLTPHGRTLLLRARTLIHDLESLEFLSASLRQGWEPELKLVVEAAYPRSKLLDIVRELQQACPRTQIQLSDAVLSGAEEAIERGLADVVVTSRIPQGFLGDRLLDIEFVAVAAPTHALIRLERDLTVDDLAHQTQAVVRDSGASHPRDEGWLGAEHRFTVGSMDASLAIVLAGLAYAWLPLHMVAKCIADRRLQRLPLASGGSRYVTLNIVMVTPGQPGPAARAAMTAFARES